MMEYSNKRKGKYNERIKVAVRCRPLSKAEVLQEYNSVVKVDSVNDSVEIYNTNSNSHNINQSKVFTFDTVYDSSCTQQEIYEDMVEPMVSAVLDGFNCTIFAYGQSGTGKTYTMEGDTTNMIGEGVISNAFDQIFYHISKSCNIQYLVRMSYLEIYQDDIKDLLNINSKMKYELRENKDMGIYVTNLKSFVCKDVKQMERLMVTGRRNRTIGMTDINEKSSRSHAIVIITVEMNVNSPVENRIRVGKLNLVDLAGSERQSKTNSKGKRLREASKINLSLTALGNVISALAENKEQFIPYRDSKLTRLLKDSLGGNSKTLMIATISPACYNYEETVNTLRYASRARNIKNRPVVNEDPIDTLIDKYQEEIEKLKAMLADKTALQRIKKTKMCNNNETEAEAPMLENKSNICCEENYHEKVSTVKSVNEEFEKEYVEQLMGRIEAMENRLLTGSTTFFEHTSKQQQTLESQINEIKSSRKREKEMQIIINLKEQSAEGIREEYTNLQHEVQAKSKKLIALLRELECVQQEMQDVKEDFSTDRRELEITKHELLKDIKLRLLIIDNFVTNEDRRRAYSRLYYNEDADTWDLRPEYEPHINIPKVKCCTFLRRPTTLHSIFTQRKANHIYINEETYGNREITFRFKGENILELNLVQSFPTTMVYIAPILSPLLNTAFENALQEEKDLDIDASSSSLTARKLTSSPTKIQQIKTRKEKKAIHYNVTFPIYPKARGLVPK